MLVFCIYIAVFGTLLSLVLCVFFCLSHLSAVVFFDCYKCPACFHIFIPQQVQQPFEHLLKWKHCHTACRYMEIMIRVIIALCLILTAQEVLGKTVSHDDQGTDNKQEIKFHMNPRKLKLANDVATVKSYGDDTHYHPTPVSKQEVALPEKRHGRAGKVGGHARKGTRQEWIEGTDKDTQTLEFYTMDYHWVRRRRPIHNKSFPFRHP